MQLAFIAIEATSGFQYAMKWINHSSSKAFNHNRFASPKNNCIVTIIQDERKEICRQSHHRDNPSLAVGTVASNSKLFACQAYSLNFLSSDLLVIICQFTAQAFSIIFNFSS
mmetsp:Transcript_31055/g.45426  ORF Transcript_31055/g.45426 Transcript_31055/m.45426 type:complete len:112 (+) Transcript_31055:57-392(+)